MAKANAVVGGGGTLKPDYELMLSFTEKNYEVKKRWRIDAGLIKEDESEMFSED